VFYEGGTSTAILLGMEDATDRHVPEYEKDDLLRQKEMLLDQLQHSISNSFSIIVSVILLKAKTVESEETRQDAHKRAMSVAAVQQQLHGPGGSGPIEIGALSLKAL
jgi:chemotaxis protein methyltransferase CheR